MYHSLLKLCLHFVFFDTHVGDQIFKKTTVLCNNALVAQLTLLITFESVFFFFLLVANIGASKRLQLIRIMGNGNIPIFTFCASLMALNCKGTWDMNYQ